MLGFSKPASANASGHKAPISSHPIFPIVVAVWFAALLGLGSLVLPVAIFERLFAVTGISSLVSMAQAPLGATARIAIALAAAGIGAIAGLLIARKVVAAQNAPAGRSLFTDDAEAEPAKRPISAHEELGADSFDDPVEEPADPKSEGAYSGKRRSLAVTDDSARSEFLDYAPLPGGNVTYDAPIEELGDRHAEPIGETAQSETGSDAQAEVEAEPLELVALAFDAEGLEDDGAEQLDEVVPYELADLVEEPAGAPPETPEYAIPAEDSPLDISAMTDNNAEAELPYNPLENSSSDGEEIARPYDAPTAPEVLPNEGRFAEPQVGEAAGAEAAPDTQLGSKPLNELGMVELVERFAMALQSKSAAAAVTADVAAGGETPEETVSPMVFRRSKSAAAAEEPMPAPPAENVQEEVARPAIPTAFQPLDLDGEETEDEDTDLVGLSLDFASSQPAAPTPPAGEEEPVSNDDAEDDGGYSSLLKMKTPPATPNEFVRIEEEADGGEIEPVVVFPGQETARADTDSAPREPAKPQAFPPSAAARPFDAPGSRPADGAEKNAAADAGETERALREALEKLQRMSGAA